MADLSREQQQALDAFTKAMGGGGRSFSSGKTAKDLSDKVKNADTNLKSFNDSMKKLASMSRYLSNSLEGANKLSKGFSKTLDEANKAFADNTDHLEELTESYRGLYNKSIPAQRRIIDSYSKVATKLNTEMGKSARSSALLSASMISSGAHLEEGTRSYELHMENLSKAAGKLDEGFLKYAEALDESGKQIKKGLTGEDFAKLRVRLGEAEAAIAEGVSNLGFGSMKDIVGTSTKKLKSQFGQDAAGRDRAGSVIATAAKLEKQGYNTGHKLLDANGNVDASAVAKLQHNSGALAGLTKNIAGISLRNKGAAAGLDKGARAVGTEAGSIGHRFGSAAGITAHGMDMVEELATIGGAMKMFAVAADGLKQAAKEVNDFNVAQVPASFFQVQAASVKMGMSFEDTTKFMQENKRALAIYGDGFSDLTGNLKDTFVKFGYNMKQAGEIVAPAIESAVASGVNIRDPKGLNNFIDQSMESFKGIAGVVNMTAAEYIKQDAAMLESQDIQSTLLGMDKNRAQAYAQDLLAMKKKYILDGLSVEQATELVRANAAARNEPVKEKIRNAALVGLRGQMSGLSSAESNEMTQLSMRDGHLSPEQQERLQDLTNRSQQGMNTRIQGAYDSSTSSGLATDAIFQATAPTGAAASRETAAGTLNMAARAGAALTPKEKKEAAEKAAGSPVVAEAGNAINSVTSLLNNGFAKAIYGAIAGLTLLGLSGALSGGGNLLGGGKGLLGKAGRLLGMGGEAAEGAVAGEGALAAGGAAVGEGALAAGGAAVGEGALGSAATLIPKVTAAGEATVGATGIGLLGSTALVGAAGAAGYGAGTLINNATADKKGMRWSEHLADMFGVDGDTRTTDDNAKAVADYYAHPHPKKIITGEGTHPEGPGAPGNVNSAADGLSKDTSLVVSDPEAKDHLSTISNSMTEAVKLLQALVDGGSDAAKAALAALNGTPGNSNGVPTVKSYMSGRS